MAKRRPAIIVSRDNKKSQDVIIAFITSVVPDGLTSTDLMFDTKHRDFRKSGLQKNSVIKLDKLATLNKAIFSGELGSKSETTLSEIDKRLKIALALK